MTIVSFNSVGSIGVVKDLPDYQVPKDGWTAATNIRFVDGYAAKITGENTLVGDLILNAQTWVMPVRREQTISWVAAHNTIVRATDGVTIYVISTGVTITANNNQNWQGGIFNTVPILNNGYDEPYYWPDASFGEDITTLPNWPTNTSCRVIRPFNAYLMAGNINKAGRRFPNLIKWSAQADPGSLPGSWDETDPTVEAGETVLGGDSDEIVDMLELGDRMIIYRRNSIWESRFIGGVYIFSFRQLHANRGIISNNCVANFPGGHAFFGLDNIYVHAGGPQMESIVDGRMRDTVFDNINNDETDLCFVAPNYNKKEVWFCYPTGSNTSCNMALIWNYELNTLSERSLPGVYHGAFGPTDIGQDSTWKSFSTTAWGSENTAWDDRKYNPTVSNLVLAGSEVYKADATNQFSGTSFTATLERTGLDFGAPHKTKRVRTVYPKISSTGSPIVYISVGYADAPGEAVTYDHPVEFYVSSDYSVDVNVNGRYIAIKFETDTNVDWKLHGFDLDVEVEGEK